MDETHKNSLAYFSKWMQMLFEIKLILILLNICCVFLNIKCIYHLVKLMSSQLLDNFDFHKKWL